VGDARKASTWIASNTAGSGRELQRQITALHSQATERARVVDAMATAAVIRMTASHLAAVLGAEHLRSDLDEISRQRAMVMLKAFIELAQLMSWPQRITPDEADSLFMGTVEAEKSVLDLQDELDNGVAAIQKLAEKVWRVVRGTPVNVDLAVAGSGHLSIIPTLETSQPS
jgi:hypothetical protein